MALQLFAHPFSSYCQKVLVAFYQNDLAFEYRSLEVPAAMAELKTRWPFARFPLLVDDGHTVVESTIIIEHLMLRHGGRTRWLPEDPIDALEVRFLDRFFDLHVMNMMQLAVDGALTGDPVKRKDGHDAAIERLERSYAWLDAELAGRTWALGSHFTMADCAAAPSLFYADWVHRIPESYPVLRAYRTRLLARPSFARCVEEARQFRPLFPLGAPDRD